MTARHCWRLTVRDEFSAGHALRHYQGKCENLHGHNFGVELCVEGRDLTPDTELLLDFKILKTALKDVLRELDHRVLNPLTAPIPRRRISPATSGGVWPPVWPKARTRRPAPCVWSA